MPPATAAKDASPRPAPSPSPLRISKTCWKGCPSLLTDAIRRAGLELSTDLSLLPGHMLSLQHHARMQQVQDLLKEFAPARKLLKMMTKLDEGLMFSKQSIYLGLKLWSRDKKLRKQGRIRFLYQETARLFLFAKGARALKRKECSAGDDGEGDTDQDEADDSEPEPSEEESDKADEALI